MHKTQVFFIILISVFSSNLYAYIDPGSAGLLYQIIYALFAATVAWFAGIGFFVKKIFKKIIGRKENKNNDNNNTAK